MTASGLAIWQSLRRQNNYIEVTLLESRPHSVGRTTKFVGIPGSLFAFAALSFAIGREGFTVVEAKTNLIEHLEEPLRVSNGSGRARG